MMNCMKVAPFLGLVVDVVLALRRKRTNRGHESARDITSCADGIPEREKKREGEKIR